MFELHQDKNKAKCVLEVTFDHLCTLPGIFSCYCLVVLYRPRSCIKYGTQCGETSTILAEMRSSVSSVGVQSKGSFIVFLVIKMSLFPASV